jgi:hypothetical protein
MTREALVPFVQVKSASGLIFHPVLKYEPELPSTPKSMTFPHW